ncbi:MAG: guanylate kinase [Bacteroidia bacterium]|nr:guanylate kinase [Bacteroidia bacterium]
MPDKEIFIFSAPSGAGKTTLVKAAIQAFPQLRFSISATTRKPRGLEVSGQDYYFISEEEFREGIRKGRFLEWQEVYSGRFYGTYHSELERIRKENGKIVFDVDVKGGLNLKEIFGEQSLALFIMPPNLQILRQRLESRSTDSPQDIETRIQKAAYEMTFAPRFDAIIVNDDLTKATAEVLSILQTYLT